MRMSGEHERLVRMIKESISLMCKSSLNYDMELNVEGLLGITLDKRDVVLVNINESFQTAQKPTTEAEHSTSASEQSKKHQVIEIKEEQEHPLQSPRRKRPRRRSRDSPVHIEPAGVTADFELPEFSSHVVGTRETSDLTANLPKRHRTETTTSHGVHLSHKNLAAGDSSVTELGGNMNTDEIIIKEEVQDDPCGDGDAEDFSSSDDHTQQHHLAFPFQGSPEDAQQLPASSYLGVLPGTSTDSSQQGFTKKIHPKSAWAVKLFRDWSGHNVTVGQSEPIVVTPTGPPLEEMTKGELNFTLARFLGEVKKKGGGDFPADSLRAILLGIQSYLQVECGVKYQFTLHDDFTHLRETLFSLMQERTSQVGCNGIICARKAKVITVEEEEKMWSQNILGDSTPQQLIDTLIYLIGLNFCIKGGQEHRDLLWDDPTTGVKSQLQVLTEADGTRFLRYTQDTSKANQQRDTSRHKMRQVDAFENKETPERCIVRLFEKYVEHCPPERPPTFYLRPLDKPLKSAKNVWYTAQPYGRHSLGQTVAKLCKRAGLSGFRSNHSLRTPTFTRCLLPS